MTNEELDRLEALCDAATEGPWEWRSDQLSPAHAEDWCLSPGVLIADGTDGTPGGDELDRANAALIAASRHAIPVLIAEVRALRARAEKAEEWNRQMVAKAAEQSSLEGYRELGQKLSAADARAEALRAELDDMRGVVEAAERLCQSHGDPVDKTKRGWMKPRLDAYVALLDALDALKAQQEQKQ